MFFYFTTSDNIAHWKVPGAASVAIDDDPVYGSALRGTGLERQQCAVHMQHTMDWHLRCIDPDVLIHLDRAVLQVLKRRVGPDGTWESSDGRPGAAVAPGRLRCGNCPGT